MHYNAGPSCAMCNVLDITSCNGKGVKLSSGITENVRLLLHDVHPIALLI